MTGVILPSIVELGSINGYYGKRTVGFSAAISLIKDKMAFFAAAEELV